MLLFCTEKFCLFLVVVLITYWSLPWKNARIYLLLGASFYFYATWAPRLALLIFASTTIDYWLARGIEASRDPRRRKLLLAVNLAGNLGLLCFFKYVNFFLANFKEVLTHAGLDASALRPLELLLPVGISFYTFEAISYVVDVYRGRVKAEKNLAHFQLFILFFPHLVLGPIVRGRDFLPQVRRAKRWSWPRFQVGVQLLLLGTFKKLAIADRMAAFADPVFADPSAYSTLAVWCAVLAYALQVYCDFSGYSDVALGCAHMLGYHLARNFDLPYISLNITEFWRRWHVSLGAWLRDYVFIPLGGSRGGAWATTRNLMMTMTLCGLWHGPSWNFIAWGSLQGVLLLVHRWFRAACERARPLDRALQSPPGIGLRWLLTFLSVCLGYVIFHTLSFQGTGTFLTRLVVPTVGAPVPAPLAVLLLALAVVIACHLLAASVAWEKWWWRLPAPVLGVGYAMTLFLALSLSPIGTRAFIYVQF